MKPKLQHSCFLINIPKFLEWLFLKNTVKTETEKTWKVSHPNSHHFLHDFSHVITVSTFESCFSNIYLGCCLLLKAIAFLLLLFWISCTNFLFYLFYTFDFNNEIIDISELLFFEFVDLKTYKECDWI